MLLLLVAPRSQHDHSKCVCLLLEQQEMIPFRIAKIFTELLRNRSEGSFYTPYFNVFVLLLLLLLPAPQDNNKNKLTAGRVQFSFARKASFQILPGSIRSFSFVNFPPNFPLINRT